MRELGMPSDARWCRWTTAGTVRAGVIAGIRLEDHTHLFRPAAMYLPQVVPTQWHGYSFEAFGAYVDPAPDPPVWPYRWFRLSAGAEPTYAQLWRLRAWREGLDFVSEVRWRPGWREPQLWIGGAPRLPRQKSEYPSVRDGFRLFTDLVPSSDPGPKASFVSKEASIDALHRATRELARDHYLVTNEKLMEQMGLGRTAFYGYVKDYVVDVDAEVLKAGGRRRRQKIGRR
jgi:hypothetical protein